MCRDARNARIKNSHIRRNLWVAPIKEKKLENVIGDSLSMCTKDLMNHVEHFEGLPIQGTRKRKLRAQPLKTLREGNF